MSTWTADDSARLERSLMPFHRKPMRKVGMSLFLEAIPGLSQRVRLVPASAVAGADGEDLLITCPCGHKPTATAEALSECPGECGRHYIASKAMAYVVYGNLDPPPQRR